MPTGEIIAHPARGAFMGNRGILHDDTGQLGAVRWRHKSWITCRLSFKARRRPIMAPHAYTELFFHDEAVACAAGHRPCAECRRADYNAFRAAWHDAFGSLPSATEIDTVLHAARTRRGQRQLVRHTAEIQGLPSGAFILWQGAPARVAATRLYPFGPAGYGAPLRRPASGSVCVLTPAPLLAVMLAGWKPTLAIDHGRET